MYLSDIVESIGFLKQKLIPSGAFLYVKYVPMW